MNPWPFRRDILSALKGLHPKFVRFPGGCYVEVGRAGAPGL
jgi:alpha-L-arabinofuranosidase